MAKLIIGSVFLCTVLSSSFAILQKHWDNDVYSGRQWDDLITQTKIPSPEVIRPAVLVMYTPRCQRLVSMEKLGANRLPPNHYMVFAKYDYEYSPKYIWYEMDARDDLKSRYNPQNCPEYMYFAKGTSHEDEPERYDKNAGEPVFHWIWSKFIVKVNVVNNRKTRIMIEFQGQGPKISAFTIDAGQDMILEAYASYFMLIVDAERQTFLIGEELTMESNGKLYVAEIGQSMDVRPEVWYKEQKTLQEAEDTKMRNWRWNVAEIYLHDFKQPVLLEKFTEVGYKHGKMPAEMYRQLIEFYQDNIESRQAEEHYVEPAINDSEVKCGMVLFNDEMIQMVAKTMKPLMEEWCNCTLELSRLYGIREYYTGNILRNHVDRVTTHVVSVILQIDKDLGGQPDWELEVIGFDGHRKNVTLQPGEMLFYESATLIHGRPFPFQGKVFANAFLHYRPVHGWYWGLNNDLTYLTYKGQEVEKVDVFASPNIMDKKASREMFVEKHAHEHDEL